MLPYIAGVFVIDAPGSCIGVVLRLASGADCSCAIGVDAVLVGNVSYWCRFARFAAPVHLVFCIDIFVDAFDVTVLVALVLWLLGPSLFVDHAQSWVRIVRYAPTCLALLTLVWRWLHSSLSFRWHCFLFLSSGLCVPCWRVVVLQLMIMLL